MEVSGTVAVLGAVGTLLAGVIGTLGAWYLKIMSERNKMLLAEKELDIRAKKEDAVAARSKEAIKELNSAIDQLSQDRDDDRKEIHELRGRLNEQALELAVCKVKLQTCEDDRQELRGHVVQMAGEMRRAGMFVPPIQPPNPPDPPPTKGGAP
jgi:septal ring factor EnvC (AmiA/AmiB activator)